MNRRHAAQLIALGSLGLVCLPGRALPQQKSLKEQIVGTWQTVSLVQERDDGSKVPYYGGKVKGLSIYTSDGHFSQMNYQSDMPKIASGNRQTATPDEAQTVVRQSYAIFGTYTVNPADGTYTVRIEGSTFPNEIGREQVRNDSNVGNEMVFTNPAPASGGKGAINTLRRVE